MNTLTKLFDIETAAAILRTRPLPKVYPAYIASQIKQALRAGDLENIIDAESVGAIETIGDCKYRIRLSDDEGNSYFITVEVAQ